MSKMTDVECLRQVKKMIYGLDRVWAEKEQDLPPEERATKLFRDELIVRFEEIIDGDEDLRGGKR